MEWDFEHCAGWIPGGFGMILAEVQYLRRCRCFREWPEYKGGHGEWGWYRWYLIFFCPKFWWFCAKRWRKQPTTLVERTLLFDQSFEILMCCSSTLNSEALAEYLAATPKEWWSAPKIVPPKGQSMWSPRPPNTHGHFGKGWVCPKL